jgi:hypothetical protein
MSHGARSWWESGSPVAARIARDNGISHFIEHMLFRGRPAGLPKISALGDSIGGNLDAFTAKGLVCFNTGSGSAPLRRSTSLGTWLSHVPRGG